MDEYFEDMMKNMASKIGIELSKDNINKFELYMNLLIEWNKKINLTAIVDKDEIILKHFIDSLTIVKYLKGNEKIIDIGTGAGFPGVPVSILKDECKITLLDSLNKRIQFLEDVKNNLKLDNVECFHLRAEEGSRKKEFREKYDIATSRAVAKLNVLVEYLLPYVKHSGKCICMKGANSEEEIEEAKFAVNELGGKIIKVENILLPNTDMKRTIIIIEKIKLTPEKYPRNVGIPLKKPLVFK